MRLGTQERRFCCACVLLDVDSFLVSQVLKFKDHKDPLVRKTTISLVPVLAGFNPQAFNLSHLQPCASFMLTVMKKEKGTERSAAFLGTF
jgi:FKBP12-rapamycin complex-associated protein